MKRGRAERSVRLSPSGFVSKDYHSLLLLFLLLLPLLFLIFYYPSSIPTPHKHPAPVCLPANCTIPAIDRLAPVHIIHPQPFSLANSDSAARNTPRFFPLASPTLSLLLPFLLSPLLFTTITITTTTLRVIIIHRALHNCDAFQTPIRVPRVPPAIDLENLPSSYFRLL